MSHSPHSSGLKQFPAFGWPPGDWSAGQAEATVFRHAQNDWVDWTQGPNALNADGSVEQRVNWEYLMDNLPESGARFVIPWNR